MRKAGIKTGKWENEVKIRVKIVMSLLLSRKNSKMLFDVHSLL